jgi:putative ABC transport system ATP-binding protein
MITAHSISKSYHTNTAETRVLRNISFTMDRGDFVCVAGRSGSGKSTFLNILSTLLSPDEGYVTFDGVNITGLQEKKRNRLRQNDFAMIFQFHHLMPYLTAAENVLLPYLNSWKPVTKSTLKRVHTCLDRVGLKYKYNRLPGQLSGGEQQRVAIARSLVKSPQVLFADEPTGNLDKKTGDAIIQLLSTLNREGLSILMVTHETAYASVSNRVVIMEDGVAKEQSQAL